MWRNLWPRRTSSRTVCICPRRNETSGLFCLSLRWSRQRAVPAKYKWTTLRFWISWWLQTTRSVGFFTIRGKNNIVVSSCFAVIVWTSCRHLSGWYVHFSPGQRSMYVTNFYSEHQSSLMHHVRKTTFAVLFSSETCMHHDATARRYPSDVCIPCEQCSLLPSCLTYE